MTTTNDTAAHLMTPGVVTIGADASVADAQRALVAHRVHAVLVVTADGSPVGWATDEGLLCFADRDAELVDVGAAVSGVPVAVDPGTPAYDLIETMRHPDVTRVLVCAAAGRAPLGVVSRTDLLRKALRTPTPSAVHA